MFRHSFIAVALAACATSSGGGAGSSDAVATYPFAPVLGVELSAMTRSVSGLYTRDLTPGNGVRVTTGDLVRVRYTVHLADGTFIAGTNPGDAPLEFRLGRRQVIAGWDEGVMGMRMGGTRQLVVPPSLAYGGRANGNIPPNSILVFTIELVSLGT
jgi:FKBP-type peptidyl-prolyl cis-trans isomerase